MKHFSRIIGLALVCLMLSACDGWKHRYDDETRRTVIIYMEARSNLAKFAKSNIGTLLRSVDEASLQNGRLLIYYRDYNCAPHLMEVCPRVQLKNGNSSYRIADTVTLKTFDPNLDYSHPATMKSILSEARRLAPADEYGLLLWSHSTGWLPRTRSDVKKAFGVDGMKYMFDFDEIARVIGDFDWEFIAMDACFGGSVESLYDMRMCARYWVGSPTEVMGDGFPYDRIVPFLFWKDTQTGMKLLCQSYVDSYQDADVASASVILVDLEQMDSLAACVRDITEVWQPETVNLKQIQIYDGHNPTRFHDLAQYLRMALPRSETARYDAFSSQMERCRLYWHHTPTIYSNLDRPVTFRMDDEACGLTVYIPQTANMDADVPFYNEQYPYCAWAIDTGMARN